MFERKKKNYIIVNHIYECLVVHHWKIDNTEHFLKNEYISIMSSVAVNFRFSGFIIIIIIIIITFLIVFISVFYYELTQRKLIRLRPFSRFTLFRMRRQLRRWLNLVYTTWLNLPFKFSWFSLITIVISCFMISIIYWSTIMLILGIILAIYSPNISKAFLFSLCWNIHSLCLIKLFYLFIVLFCEDLF